MNLRYLGSDDSAREVCGGARAKSEISVFGGNSALPWRAGMCMIVHGRDCVWRASWEHLHDMHDGEIYPRRFRSGGRMVPDNLDWLSVDGPAGVSSLAGTCFCRGALVA